MILRAFGHLPKRLETFGSEGVAAVIRSAVADDSIAAVAGGGRTGGAHEPVRSVAVSGSETPDLPHPTDLVVDRLGGRSEGDIEVGLGSGVVGDGAPT